MFPYQPKIFVNNKHDNIKVFNLLCLFFNSEPMHYQWKSNIECMIYIPLPTQLCRWPLILWKNRMISHIIFPIIPLLIYENLLKEITYSGETNTYCLLINTFFFSYHPNTFVKKLFANISFRNISCTFFNSDSMHYQWEYNKECFLLFPHPTQLCQWLFIMS